MRIVVLSAHAESLRWFRYDMMQDFSKNGHEVIAVGPCTEREEVDFWRESGIRYVAIDTDRNGLSPIGDAAYFLRILMFLRKVKPDRVFSYQAKPVIYGSLAARVLRIPGTYALIGGLGSIFRSVDRRNAPRRMIMRVLYYLAGRCVDAMFFQNTDDQEYFISKRLVRRHRAVIINGSGVNIEHFAEQPQPAEPAVLFVGRLIRDKGVIEYLNACNILKRKHPKTRFELVGPYDTNPTALQPEEIQPFIDAGVIELAGPQKDVRPFLRACSIFVLPSYHEGTPKSVLEAMSVGRAVVTTDAPGCRDTVVDGVNGYLVPPRDHVALVDALDKILSDPDLGARMGVASREIAASKYEVGKVNREIMKVMRLPVQGQQEVMS